MSTTEDVPADQFDGDDGEVDSHIMYRVLTYLGCGNNAEAVSGDGGRSAENQRNARERRQGTQRPLISG
jgi:hypothetical protein